MTVRNRRAFLETASGLVRGAGAKVPELTAGDGAGQLRELLHVLGNTH